MRGKALLGVLSCRLPAYLNSRGSPVVPTCADIWIIKLQSSWGCACTRKDVPFFPAPVILELPFKIPLFPFSLPSPLCWIRLGITTNHSGRVVSKLSPSGPGFSNSKIPTQLAAILVAQDVIPIETVSADGRSARPARLGGHPIWWRWHGNTKSLSKVQSSDV